MNPYTDATFFSFFALLFQHLTQFFDPDFSLYPDEIQLFVILFSSLLCAFLGVWLFLRKMTMLANALSHTILLGIVLAYVVYQSVTGHVTYGTFHIPFMFLMGASLLTALVTTYLVTFLHHHVLLYKDASIAIIFTSLFAVGILLSNLVTRNAHVGLEAVMGNPDGLTLDDLQLAFPLFLFTLGALFCLNKPLTLSTFDHEFATTQGLPLTLINYTLMTLVSLALITSFRAVGVIMVLSFITAPPLIAKKFSSTLRSMFCLTFLITCSVCLVSVALSRHLFTTWGLALSTGGLTVTLLACLTLLLLTTSKAFQVVNRQTLKK